MELTTSHSASSYGTPVLIDEDGQAYGPGDMLPSGESAADYVRRKMPGDPGAERFLEGQP